MVIISTSRTIYSPKEIIWTIISDLDSDPTYWQGIKEARNLRVDGNVIERETIISFQHSKSQEIITLEPSNQITINIINGPIIGKKVLRLTNVSDNESYLDVNWDIHLKGFIRVFTPMVKKHILAGTINAMERIAKEAEKRYKETKVK